MSPPESDYSVLVHVRMLTVSETKKKMGMSLLLRCGYKALYSGWKYRWGVHLTRVIPRQVRANTRPMHTFKKILYGGVIFLYGQGLLANADRGAVAEDQYVQEPVVVLPRAEVCRTRRPGG